MNDIPELKCPVCGGSVVVDGRSVNRDASHTPEGDVLTSLSFECETELCILWKCKVWIKENVTAEALTEEARICA